MKDIQTSVSENGKLNGTAGEFSPKEKEVLFWLAEGLSSKMIACQMQITKDTVETHRKRIFKKMKVTNVAMAIAYGFRHKLLE
jgi:DNA-binding CsgD family transcriptional regulator